MTLMHFEPAVGSTTTRSAVVTSEVQVVAAPSTARAFVAKTDEVWEWSDLRDYVVHQIEQRFGTFPRDFKKESGIFKSYLSRYGTAAPAIARFAFEIEGGYWAGAPISINRWCRGSDPFFSDKIAARLVAEPVSGW